MFFNDHSPPHFHISYQGYNATIEIETGLITGKFPRRALKLVYNWMDLHQQELMSNWNKMLDRKPMDNIEPLKK